MDQGAWQTTFHEIAELYMTEHMRAHTHTHTHNLGDYLGQVLP